MSGELWYAVRGNNTSKTRKLLENGASIGMATKSDGWTLLHSAAYTKGNLMMVKLLLDHKADINAKYFFWLVLTLLAEYVLFSPGFQKQAGPLSTAPSCPTTRFSWKSSCREVPTQA